MLNVENCRNRQRRLLREMEAQELGIVVLGNPKTIYYFSGALVDPSWPQLFALAASGKSLLVTNQEPKQSAADRVELYTGYTLDRLFGFATMNAEAAGFLQGFAASAAGPAGLDYEFANYGLAEALAGRDLSNITPVLDELRRVKDPDEIECMRATVALVEVGYAAIKSRLEPGMTEYQAYNIIYEAIVNRAQTSVEFKGDFACGARAIRGGGPPTSRKVQPGDTYILDLFPIYNGYMCDLCRTFAAGKPSQLQQDAWAHIMEAHRIAGRILRPGARARDVYQEIRSHLDRFAPAAGSFFHHAGHGLGMNGWEFPWLTPGSGQVVQEGEVIACEPGLYSEELQGGIRLEHNYLVGKDGVTALDSFPMELR